MTNEHYPPTGGVEPDPPELVPTDKVALLKENEYLRKLVSHYRRYFICNDPGCHVCRVFDEELVKDGLEPEIGKGGQTWVNEEGELVTNKEEDK